MSTLEKFTPIEAQRSASERVVERLTGLIASGNIAPGDRLPSENELGKALHVSRPVVREALRGLAMLGIVETKQGGRCFVTDLAPKRLLAPLSLALSLSGYPLASTFRAREVIDSGICADAARHATSEQVALLRDFAVAGHTLADDPVGFRVMDAEFHATIAAAAGNEFLESLSRSLYSLAIEQRRMASARPGVLSQSARDHEAIVEAIARHDPEEAGAAMLRHVAHIRESTMAVLGKTPRAAGRMVSAAAVL